MKHRLAAAALAAFLMSGGWWGAPALAQEGHVPRSLGEGGCIRPQDRSAAAMATYKDIEISAHLGVELRRLLVPLKVKERLDIWPVDLAVVYHVPGAAMVTVDFFYRACGVASFYLTEDDYRLLVGLPAPPPPVPGEDT